MNATRRFLPGCLTACALLVSLLAFSAPAFAQPNRDAVEKLRQVLLTTVDTLPERDQRTKACLGELHTLTELRKAVVLREWRHRHANVELAEVDQANRSALAERFCKATKKILAGNEAGATLAVLDMLSETAASLRAIGEATVLTRPLTEDVARLLDDNDAGVRAAAAKTLGQIDPDLTIVLPLLTKQAAAADAGRRLDAATALHQLLQTTAQPWTTKEYNPAIIPPRVQTATAAAQFLPLAGVGVADKDNEVRRQSLSTLALAASLLGKMIPPVRQEPLELNEVRALAVALLNQLKPVAPCLHGTEADVKLLALQVLEETSRARQHWLQQAAVTALPGDKPDDPLAPGLVLALPALGDVLKENDRALRRAALDTLEDYGPLAAAAAPAVALTLKDSDRFVRWGAVRTLGAIGPAARPALPILTKMLNDPDLDIRIAVENVLQVLDPSGVSSPRKPERSSLPGFIGALSGKDVETKLAALHALTAMGENAQPALAALVSAANDPEARVRLAVVQTLAALGPAARSAKPTLRQALKDEDAEVRRAAGEALLNLEREP